MTENKMTVERAQEIVSSYPNGWIAEDEFDFASGFIDGWESRQTEVDELKNLRDKKNHQIEVLKRLVRRAKERAEKSSSHRFNGERVWSV